MERTSPRRIVGPICLSLWKYTTLCSNCQFFLQFLSAFPGKIEILKRKCVERIDAGCQRALWKAQGERFSGKTDSPGEQKTPAALGSGGRKGYILSEDFSLRVIVNESSSHYLSSAHKMRTFCGDPLGLKCSGEIIRPAPRFCPGGQNACTAYTRRPICDGALSWTTGKHYSSWSASSLRVMASESSSNCLSSTKSGQLVMGSEAFCTLGKAITSRMESAPAMSMHSRSRP